MKKLVFSVQRFSFLIPALLIGIIIGSSFCLRPLYASQTDYIDPDGDGTVSSDWATTGTYYYTEIDEATRQPATPTTSDNISILTNKATNAFFRMSTFSGVDQVTQIDVWIYHNDGTNGQFLVQLYDDDEATTRSSQSSLPRQISTSGWDYVSFTSLTLTQAQLNTLSVTLGMSKPGGGGPVTAYAYAMYALVTYTTLTPTTTLGDGTDPSNSTVAAGSTNNYVDQFTFATNTGTDTVTQVVVTTANTTAIANVKIYDNTGPGGTQYYSTVSTPTGDTWTFSGGTEIPVTTSSTSFRIYFDAKTDGNLTDGNYAVTGTVTSFTCTNPTAGTDTDSATITVDDQAPSDPTGFGGAAGDQQVQLDWTNPGADFYRVLILRKADSAVTDAPTDGTEYTVPDGPIGTSTIIYVGSLQTFTDTELTNGTAYYYKIFAYDSAACLNYSSGAATGPHTPQATTTIGDGSDPSSSTVAAGSTDNYLDQFTFVVGSGSDTVTQLVVTTANTAAIANVKIYDNTGPGGTQYYSTVSSPTGDTWTFSGGTEIPVTTSSTSFRIYFDAKTDGNLTDGNYAVTGYVSSFTCTNTTGGSDSAGTTITVDDQHPQINARATTSNATTVRVTYNEAVKHVSAANANDALNTSNYVITPSLTVSSVAHVSGDTTFDLTTASQTTNTYYTIVISNVEDNVGNVIDASEDETTFLGYQAGGGAISLVQQKDARNTYNAPNSPTGWVSVTMDAAATGGKLLVTGVAIDKASGTISAPTCSGYNSMTIINKGEGGISSGAMAYKIAEGGEQTIRWDWGASEEGNMWVGEYSGIASSDVDTSAENEGNLSIATNSISTGTTVTTTQADELAVAMLISDSGNSVGSSRSWTNSFTSIFEKPVPEESGNPFLAVATKTLTSTGTVETTISWPADGVWPSDEAYATVATFKAAAAAKEFVQRSFVFQNDNGSGVDNCTNIANADTNISSVKKGERMIIRLQVAAFVSSAVSKTFKLQFERTDNPDTWTDVGASTEISYASGLTSSNGTATASEVATACRDTWVNGTWHEGTGSTSGNVSLNDGQNTEFAFMIHTGNATLNKSYNLRLYNNTDSDTLIYHKTPQLTVVDSTNDTMRYSKEDITTLKTDTTDCTYYLDNAGYSEVGDDDSGFETVTASSGNLVYNFARKNSNSTDYISFDWNGKSSVAAGTSSIKLQVYRFGSTNTWVDVTTESSLGANTEGWIPGVIMETETVGEYYSSNWTYWRVYQAASGSTTLSTDYIEFNFGATAVDLTDFYAIGYDNKVILKWKTEAEINNFGFNVYRARDGTGDYIKINTALIVGQGTSAMGHEYTFVDNDVVSGEAYHYLLEDMEYSGATKRHGPVTAHPGLDSDGDGMSDDYEIHFGLNPHDAGDANLDPDGDGRTNLEEYEALTDPTRPEIVSIKLTDVNVIDETDDYLVLELDTSTLMSKEVTVGGVTYQEVWLPEYIHSYTQVPGQPMLPEKGMLIGTKAFNKASVEILAAEYTTYLNYNIYPQTKYIQETDPATGITSVKRQFYLDETAYEQDDFFPGALTDIDYSYYMRDQKMIHLRLYPLQYNPYTDELRRYTKIRIRLDFTDAYEASAVFNVPDDLYKSGSLKLFIEEEGIYRLTQEYLEARGIDTSSIYPKRIRVFNQGKEIPIHIEGESDGYFDYGDYIEFYAEEIYSAYTASNVYWLMLNSDENHASIESQGIVEASSFFSASSYSCSKHIELDEDYWMDVEEVESPWFFAQYLWAPCETNYVFNLEDPLLSSQEAELTLTLYGLSYGMDALGHHAYIYVNDYFVGEEEWQGDEKHTFSIRLPAYYLHEEENTLAINLPGDLYQLFELALLDSIDVTYPRRLRAEDDMIIFSPNIEGAYKFTVDGFTDGDIEIFKIKASGAVKEINVFSMTAGASYIVAFNDITELTDKYAIFADAGHKNPAGLLADEPSNLSSRSNQADYIIITPEGLYDSIMELANYRQSQGLTVKTIKTQDIYDEFNYGIPEPRAVKAFLNYAYEKWKAPRPKYVLLAGDSTFDPKDIYGYGLFDYVPTHFVFTEYFGWTADDSYFVCFDSEEDLLPEMLIGRLPAKTADELSVMIGKIKAYEALDEKTINWAKNVTLVADEADDNNFPAITDSLAEYLADDIKDRKIYFDEYALTSEVRYDIIDSINDGSLIFTYAGHGGVQLISNHYLFQNSSINSLFNTERYPFMVMLTCGNGYFIYPQYFECLAEELMRPQDKGAIAVLASSGATYSHHQRHLGRGLHKAIFEDDDYVLGSAVAQAKIYLYNQAGNEGKLVSKTFNLFGDPALKLKGYDAAQLREASSQLEPAVFDLVEPEGAEVLNNENTSDLTDYESDILETALENVELEDSEGDTYEFVKEEKVLKGGVIVVDKNEGKARLINEENTETQEEIEESELELDPAIMVQPKKARLIIEPKKLEEKVGFLEVVKNEVTGTEAVPDKKEKALTPQKSVWERIREIIMSLLRRIAERIKNLF